MVGEGIAISQPLLLKKYISYITNIETKETPYPVDGITSSAKDVLYVVFYKTLML